MGEATTERRLTNLSQAARLHELSFEWSVSSAKFARFFLDGKDREAGWEAGFAELLAYKERFGHCRVPARWPENRTLGGWVDRMRVLQKGLAAGGSISGWTLRRSLATWQWEQQFAALERYRELFTAGCRVAGRKIRGVGGMGSEQACAEGSPESRTGGSDGCPRL